MAYSSITKPSDYFNTKLYTGTGASNAITGVGFQPDWTWIKKRNATRDHSLFDSVRGVQKQLASNLTDAESSSANYLTSFDTDGFTVGSSSNVNASSDTYASWNWLASHTTASNTDGSITSTVSANTTSGFSIVSYTGTGSAGTVGHGLNKEVDMLIVKNRDTTNGWRVYFRDLNATKYLTLDANVASVSSSAIWNNTHPTSSVFSIGTGTSVNGSGNNLIAYCFASIKGYSKVGYYTGNANSSGPFVYTGFKPAYLFFKMQGTTAAWRVFDSKRPGYNVIDDRISPSGSGGEATEVTCDFLSNGFKIRTTDTAVNASGEMVNYFAIAENPLVANVSGGIPATAR